VDGSLFEFNPCAKLTVTKDCTAAITLFLLDTRWMESQYQSKYSLNIRDVAMHRSSVYITDAKEPSASPEKILTILPEVRQATNVEVQLKKGHEYHVTAATFAPDSRGRSPLAWQAMVTHVHLGFVERPTTCASCCG